MESPAPAPIQNLTREVLQASFLVASTELIVVNINNFTLLQLQLQNY